MELQAKLEQLRKTVLDDAQIRREERLEALKSEKAKYIKEMQEEVLSDTGRYIATEERKLERTAKKERSAWEFEEMKQLRKKRLEIEEKVMGELKENLLAFVRSSAYKEWLQAQLQKVDLAAFSEQTVALCATEHLIEEQLLKAVKPEIRLECDPDIEIGGIRLKDEKRRVMVDLTLDERMEEARHTFLKVAQLGWKE